MSNFILETRNLTKEFKGFTAVNDVNLKISAVFPHLTVLQNVRIGLQRQLGTTFHFWQSERSLNQLNARAMELLAEVDLTEFADTVT
eukprot:gene186-273_t